MTEHSQPKGGRYGVSAAGACAGSRFYAAIQIQKHLVKRTKSFKKLTPEVVAQVRQLLEDGLSNYNVGEQLGISASAVSRIRTGKSYKEIT